jgi:hypothetical protein
MTARTTYRLLLVAAATGAALLPSGCGTESGQNTQALQLPSRDPAVPTNASGETPAPVEASVIGMNTAEYTALLDEGILGLETAANDATTFGPKRKMLRTEALALAVYAQVGMNEGDKERTKKLSLVRNSALGFATAAEGNNREEAVRISTLAKGFRATNIESQPRSASIPLNRIISLTNLMEHAGIINASLNEYEAAAPEDWGHPTKREAILRNTWRMAALVRAMTEHAPATDPNPKKGQTRQLWQETLRDCRNAIDAMQSAVRSNDPKAYAVMYKSLDGACSRCHAAYRVE